MVQVHCKFQFPQKNELTPHTQQMKVICCNTHDTQINAQNWKNKALFLSHYSHPNIGASLKSLRGQTWPIHPNGLPVCQQRTMWGRRDDRGWRCELPDKLEMSSHEASVLCQRKRPMHGKCLGHQDRNEGIHIGDMIFFGITQRSCWRHVEVLIARGFMNCPMTLEHVQNHFQTIALTRAI